MTRERMREVVAEATKLVNSWPLWKRNILMQSASPTVEVPRKPVINR